MVTQFLKVIKSRVKHADERKVILKEKIIEGLPKKR